MREIASFEDERTAKLFADVLCARDIETEMSRTRDGAYAVWVLEEGDVEVSRAAWAAFDANPEAPEFAQASGCVDRKQKQEEAESRRSRHEVIQVRRTWSAGGASAARATLVFIGLSVAVTLVTLVLKREDVAEFLSIGTPDELAMGQPFYHVLHGQVWRLITPIFIHLGFFHIFFNMWWLLDLGTVLETRIGTARFTTVVLITAAFSNAAQYLVTGSPFFGGMSGVLYALFGYLWVRGRFDPSLNLSLPRGTVVVLMVWLVLGFTGVLGPIANYTHLAGLISGGLLGGRAALSNRVR